MTRLSEMADRLPWQGKCAMVQTRNAHACIVTTFVAILLFSCVFSPVASLEGYAAEDIDSRLSTLASIHEGFRSEITSAKINFHLLRFGLGGHDKYGARWDSNDVRGFMKDLEEKGATSDAYIEFLEAYTGKKLGGSELKSMEGTFISRNDKTREEYAGFVHTFDGANVVASDVANDQVTLGPKRRVKYGRLGLRFFRVAISPEGLLRMRIEHSTETLLTLVPENGHAEVEVEWPSGLVRRVTEYGKGSNIESEVYQLGTLSDESGISLPIVSVRVRYSDAGYVEHIAAMAVSDAEFNMDIPDNVFVQGVDAGVTIVDHRRQGGPLASISAAVSDDVTQHYETGGKRDYAVTMHETDEKTSNSYGIVACLVTLAVLAIVGTGFLLRRKTANSM